LEDAGEGFVRFKSELNKTNYVHIENLQNQVQYGNILPAWWSAMWVLEPEIILTSLTDIRFENSAGIYPNPSNGDFNLSLSNFAGNENVSITIFNLDGKAVYNKLYNIEDNGIKNVKVSVSHFLPAGNYFVVVKGKSTFTRAKLLIYK
jgi:hypothetical protein